MIDQTWKDRLQTEPLLGCFVTFASPAICEFTAEIGFDFTLIDNEHGLMNDETLENMVRASQAADCPSIVRIPFNQPDYIRRALDFGANGIQVPLVNDVADAHKVVKASHFPPFGERGVAFQTRPRAVRDGAGQGGLLVRRGPGQARGGARRNRRGG